MLYKSPDFLPIFFRNQSVFIAGGISGCPDWQTEIITYMDTETYDVVNPRRTGGFDTTGLIAKEQIAWEHNALNKIDACIFWFPEETLCPITLFELGKQLVKTKESSMSLIIGWHPNYARAFDLKVQIGLDNFSKYELLYSGAGWDEFVDAVKHEWS